MPSCLNQTFASALFRTKHRPVSQAYPDVLYGKYSRLGEMPCGDVFYFDYGCVAFWGLTQKQEQVRFWTVLPRRPTLFRRT